MSSAKRAIETRQKAGLSLADIAAETGINKGNLSKLVRGVRPPSPAERRALGIVPPKPRSIRVRMSVTEASYIVYVLSARAGDFPARDALAQRLARALDKSNHVNRQ